MSPKEKKTRLDTHISKTPLSLCELCIKPFYGSKNYLDNS